MIIEFLIDFALGFFDLLLLLVPDIQIVNFSSAFSYFFDILTDVCFFLPMDTVASIFSVIYGLFVLRLFIATLKTIWGIIPVL